MVIDIIRVFSYTAANTLVIIFNGLRHVHQTSINSPLYLFGGVYNTQFHRRTEDSEFP